MYIRREPVTAGHAMRFSGLSRRSTTAYRDSARKSHAIGHVATRLVVRIIEAWCNCEVRGGCDERDPGDDLARVGGRDALR